MNDKKHRQDVSLTTRNSDAPVVRSSVATTDDYSKYRESLRHDCWYSCAYCNISEYEARGIRFTIDHYLPQDRYPELVAEYENLFWACDPCNTNKGIKPSEAAALKGYRFYRADFDNPRDHLRISLANEQMLEPLTDAVGKYTIETLRLNRHVLRKVRELRARIARSEALMERGLVAIRSLKLDTLPRELRGRFEVTKRRLEERGEVVEDLLCEKVLREANRSELLDRDENETEEVKRRKAYLKRIDTLPSTLINRQQSAGRKMTKKRQTSR